MKKFLSSLFLFVLSTYALAGNPPPFRNSDGSTRWQHVANFSASILILTLLVVALFLFFANRRAARANRELTDIKATLEDRVARRTATLQETAAHLQNREAYITSIVDSMPLMLIGLNQHLDITQWNRVAENITGRPIADVIGKNLWDAYPSITLTPTQVREVLLSQKTINIKHSQHGQYHFDFTLYALSKSLTDSPLGLGINTGIVILVNDITKQVNAETKLSERDKMSAMGELASTMAYDISLPLQSILNRVADVQTQLTRSESSDVNSPLLKLLNSAQQSGQQATAIIQHLLTLENIHTEQKQLADIPLIMDECITLARRLFADENGISFSHIAIAKNYATSPPKIWCFAPEIHQVLVRILRSAFYALNASQQINGGAITPSIHIEIGDFYDSLWIKVHHNGKSLSAAEQQDIFQPFFSITQNAPACPVELRLSYSYFIITDHHQGQMAVTSDDESGTNFHIQLPLV
jgi:PAS domain S-box-containing protein